MTRRYLPALLSIFLFSFGLAVACLGTEPRSLDRAVMLAGIQDAGPQWVAAEAQYPALTVVLFALYSNHPAFQSMLHDWGHNTTFPVIGRCFPENEIVPDVGSAEAACGRHVIGKINTYGYAYLRQFAVDRHGVAHRLIVPTAASAVEDLLAAGLETLERKRASAKPVALRDWGEAGLDVVQAPLLVVAGAESLAARDGAMVVREAARRPVLGDAVVRAATSGWVWKTGGVLAVGYEEVGELGCAVQTIAGGQQLSCARLFPDGALAVRRNSRISG